MTLIQPSAFSGSEPRKRRRIIILMAARGFQLRLSRWFQRSHASVSQSQDEDDRGGERNGLMRSHLDQIVPVTDFAGTSNSKALAVRVEPAKTVALKVSMHCYGCARKVEKQVKKLQGVVSIRVELESKRLTVVGDVSPTDVLECVCKVTKHAEILQAP
ncbi:Heavy metal-associated isoprenylated plant protein 34 [Zea mays]|uniref:Heavy metal-associated isoprenylated plant protein 34 n=2 Tax=Zea mays TaxID=4577 RepID=A0A3L6DVN4_MAIZE|nr:Heavy metal-associated isoprenylated plant protein 34 [Zea mays]